MKINYGIINNNIDITKNVLEKCIKQNVIYIPSGANRRDFLFTDPLVNIHKFIIIYDNEGNYTEYDEYTEIYIDTQTNLIYTDSVPEYIKKIYPNIFEKLKNIQQKLKLDYGSFNEELSEQMMAARYLTGSEKVLELGSNIGRNTLIIASILDDDTNLVTLECDINIAEQLTHNKEINNLNFHIENSALSKRKLIQKGWITICSDNILEGYKQVNTITFEELSTKYNIKFDTLVLDCEGAFYYIIMDMPEILDNINLIIMENDYHDFSHKEYVDNVLKNNNFKLDYVEAGGWGPCYNNFFEVWKK